MRLVRLSTTFVVAMLLARSLIAAGLVFTDSSNRYNGHCEQYYQRLVRRGIAPSGLRDSLLAWWGRLGFLDASVS
ncbi:MAG: hypothetical protein D6800_07655, partial [Candidatus Zixiibacteriota bacterium]